MRKLEHAEPEVFRKLMKGEASRDEVLTIVRHLLAGCVCCGERSETAQEEAGPPQHWSYDAAFDGAEERLLGRPAPRPARLRLAHGGLRG
jgi:hypothetical protein